VNQPSPYSDHGEALRARLERLERLVVVLAKLSLRDVDDRDARGALMEIYSDGMPYMHPEKIK
jgi:hypothetical protein